MRLPDTGRFNRRIKIQSRPTTQDVHGQQSTAWADLLTCWAEIRPLSGRELESAQAVQSEVSHEIRILYRTTVTPAMRVLYQGRVFSIQSVIDTDTAHTELRLLCSEGLNPG